jgi:hypothetical protein
MRIFDRAKDFLFSMAQQRSVVQAFLNSQHRNIVWHLLKLYFYRDSQYLRVWKVHVHKAVSSVPLMKNSKRLNVKFIKHELWGFMEDVWFNHYDSTVASVMSDLEGDSWLDLTIMRCNPRPVETHNLIDEYMEWLAGMLSSVGLVHFKEVSDKIDELLFEFPFSPEIKREEFFN